MSVDFTSIYPGERILMFSFHPEARQGGVGKAGAVCELLHTADVTHGLLPLPYGGGWDFHFVLLIWKEQKLKISYGFCKEVAIKVGNNSATGFLYLER